MPFNLGAHGELTADAETALHAGFRDLLAKFAAGVEGAHFHSDNVVDTQPQEAAAPAPAPAAPAPEPPAA